MSRTGTIASPSRYTRNVGRMPQVVVIPRISCQLGVPPSILLFGWEHALCVLYWGCIYHEAHAEILKKRSKYREGGVEPLYLKSPIFFGTPS